jgi:hypothetical protein
LRFPGGAATLGGTVMRRLLPALVFSITTVVLVGLALAPACGNECNNALDCKPGNICYRNICTPTSSMYVHCSTSHDCGGSGEFVCSSGRCILGATTPPAGTDSGSSNDGGDGGATDNGASDMGAADNGTSDGAVDGGSDGAAVDGSQGDAMSGDADAGTNDKIIATIGARTIDFTPSGASLNMGLGVTTMAGVNGTDSIQLSFAASTPGTVSCTLPNTAILYHNMALNQTYQGGTSGGVANGSCTFGVTAYPAVGMQITGTFSGTLVLTQGTGSGTVAVSNGSFMVTRLQ